MLGRLVFYGYLVLLVFSLVRECPTPMAIASSGSIVSHDQRAAARAHTARPLVRPIAKRVEGGR
jgi:hypothetical protein